MGSDVTIRTRGPLFDGQAAAAVRAWERATMEEVSTQVQQEIQRRARGFHRTRRGYMNHGIAAAHVHVYDRGSFWLVRGENNRGEVWWPWLEGTSRRNTSTRFKGYHTFRVVKNIFRRRAKRIGEEKLREYLPLMGGRP